MGTTVQLTTADGNTLNAYRSEPEGSPKGAIIVVQEIFGVNDHIRGVADGYAREGYVAIAPALFDRVRDGVELDYDEAGIDVGRKIALEDVTMDQVMIDVEAACDEVSAAGKIGIVGYSWGGYISNEAAARLYNKITAAYGYYGGQNKPHIDQQPTAPLVLHFGAEDAGIPLENVRTIDERWPEIDVHIYDGAGHGFNCDARGSYEATSAALALERTLTHFAQHLS